MEIIAHHAHVFPKDVRDTATLDVLEKFLDECEIDKAVCFAPFWNNYRGEGSSNKWLAGEIKNNSRFMAFGTIDFNKDNLEDQAEEIYQLGFAGIKLHPAYQKFKIDGAEACRVYEVAQKRGLPISFHTGIHWHRIADYNTLLYDEVAYRYPELKICMEHVGGYSFFNEAVAVMLNNRGRIFGGITSVFDREMNKYWYLGKEKVKDLIWLCGIDQLVFGLDFPYNDTEKVKLAMRTMREILSELELGEEAEQKVFGGNLLRMIGK